TPKDENGEYDFECLEALNLEQFNEQMVSLLRGESVELPVFNFKSGRQEFHGNRTTLGKDEVLVIEGIHCLNDRFSYAIPEEDKYKVYISALTALNIDEHNRIPTTDNREIRRMVRDARTRGITARETIARWQSVRRGEERHIFPHQEKANVMFNSATLYELAVLKTFAEPLLFAIPQDAPEYPEAKRLLKFLEYFLGLSCEDVPNNSLIREFIGGSIFPVG
ncbi:MAG: nucleoside kinase, partial [Lachnospiraceae bacterium]|nr:nucleoside kinase [Lachnospiraceae bacterium]